ncbi:MAG: HD domain-containing protein [Campylobacterota bacterium]|nr:HD domain-containing protein [Campylobacterota bacterium]
MTDLNIKIEKLIENKADDFEVAKVIKREIKEYLNSLSDIFTQSSGKDFFIKHTKTIDKFIKIIYKYLLRKHFSIYLPMSNYVPITIVALGSYGREQLCVYSDIDIMLIYADILGYNIKPIMEEFMILCWDSGLKLGSRVHNINEISQAVKTDITIKTSILESRLIYGSQYLWYSFQNVLSEIRHYEPKSFLLEKLEEHKKRLIKSPLNMQPNIKDGYGGMRESNMLFWIANIKYGVKNSKELINIVFNEDEYKKYRTALEYIFKVRNALHLISKKKLDIVTFDILPELSSWLGFKDTIRLSKERQCMSKILLSLHNIHNFTAVITKKITRSFFIGNNNISMLKKQRIGDALYLCDNTLYTTFKKVSKNIDSLLKELIYLPNTINKFDQSYKYFVSKTIYNKKISSSNSLIVLLLQKENLYPILKLLYNTGVLIQIIPTFKKIINQPQFDSYHKHPVDIHSIKTLYHIENIKNDFLINLYNSLSKEQVFILKLSALFHDCGKGRGKDHHIVGQNLFKKFAKSMNLNSKVTNLTSLLIRYHNIMSKVANTEDIYSQSTILAFTGILKTKEALDLLFLLTYADINSVDRRLYNSSTGLLLKELYLQSLPAFDNKELLKISSRRVAKENAIKKHKLFLNSSKREQRNILNIKSNQMFLKYKAQDIIEIALRANKIEDYGFRIFNEDNLKIRITRVISLNLGYLLGRFNFLNITSMGIYRLFNNKKFFEITFDKKIDDEDILFIEDIIKSSFDMDKKIRIKKPKILEKDITIDCNHTEDLASFKIFTKDQKGLFSYVAKIFDEFNIEITSAKIGLVRGYANDLILIEKDGNFCVNKKEIINNLIDEDSI